MSKKTDLEVMDDMDETIPSIRVLMTELLNAIVDAQDGGTPRVVATFDFDHSTKRMEMTIFEAKFPDGDMLQ